LQRTLIVIEHLEDGVSRWLLAEYREVIKVSREAGAEVVFTNVKDPILRPLLEREGAKVYAEEGWRLFNRSKAIVLDLEAEKTLEPWEDREACCLIVGGIMGDHPPRGRTRIISSYYTNAAKRNLGPHQLSVDGAVKVSLRILRGARLKEVGLVGPPVRLTIRGPFNNLIEVELPYVYPSRPDGLPDIAEELLNLLEKGIMWDEIY